MSVRSPKNNKNTVSTVSTNRKSEEFNKKICKKCNKKEIGKIAEKDFIGCDYCGNFYHPACVNLSTPLFKKLISNKELIWACQICVTNTVSTEKEAGNNFKEFQNEIKNLLKNSMDTMNGTINGLRQDIQSFKLETNTQITEFKLEIKTQLDELNEELEGVKQDILNGNELNKQLLDGEITAAVPLIKDSLKYDDLVELTDSNNDKVNILLKEMVAVESTVDNMDRMNKLNNLVLDGIPVYNSEDSSF